MVKEVDFDKVLLFHESENMTYIRKLTMSYAYYTCMGLVDKNNRVTHLGLSNTFQIIPFKDLTIEDKNVLGNEKCSKLRGNDLMSVYRINNAVKLNDSFKLFKPCRSMRYSTSEETYYLKKLLLSSINSVQVNNNGFEYDSLYSDTVDLSSDLDLSFDEDILKNIAHDYQSTLI